MLIHCRLTSHGENSIDNCHPFFVAPNLAVIHNGVMPTHYTELANLNPKHSDTWYFIERVLKNLYKNSPDFYKQENVMQEIERHNGDSNKLCFLDNKGRYAIANSIQLGKWGLV